MNILKSMFISNYMMFAMMVSSYGGWMIYRGKNPMAWGGVVLTTAPFMMVIGWLMMFKSQARTSAHFPFINFLGALGTGISIWAWVAKGSSLTAPVLALAGWMGFLMYAYWYSSFGRKPGAKIKVGSVLPEFTLKDANGATVTSSQLTECPAILMFYRGNWCPLCMAQVKEMVRHYKDIEDLGVRVALISPQPHKNTMALSKKFKVKFDFLTDQDNLAARVLGIENPNGLPMGMQMMGYKSETVLPTVIITERDGRIIWTHETDNYRIRPEPAVFLEVLRRHLAKEPAVQGI